MFRIQLYGSVALKVKLKRVIMSSVTPQGQKLVDGFQDCSASLQGLGPFGMSRSLLANT